MNALSSLRAVDTDFTDENIILLGVFFRYALNAGFKIDLLVDVEGLTNYVESHALYITGSGGKPTKEYIELALHCNADISTIMNRDDGKFAFSVLLTRRGMSVGN